jgi:hypothetical protein
MDDEPRIELVAGEEPEVFKASRVEGRQSFSVEQAQTEIKAQAALHRQTEASKEADFRRQQEAQDNRLRRLREAGLFVVFMGVILVTLGISFWAGLWSDKPDAIQEWARSVATLIIGGFVGYITGRSAK